MSTNKTTNLHLHSWAPTDRFTREEFNENWAGIDAAWGDLDGRLLSEVEARSAAVSSVQTALNAKAATSALTTETNARKTADTAEATARANADAALQTAIDEKTRVVVGTYAGNGSATRTINLGFAPKVVFVRAIDDYIGVNSYEIRSMAIAGTDALYSTATVLSLTSTGFTVRTHTTGSGAALNNSNISYMYAAFA